MTDITLGIVIWLVVVLVPSYIIRVYQVLTSKEAKYNIKWSKELGQDYSEYKKLLIPVYGFYYDVTHYVRY